MDPASAHHGHAGGIIGAFGKDTGLNLSLLVCLDSPFATSNVAANQTLRTECQSELWQQAKGTLLRDQTLDPALQASHRATYRLDL